MKTMICCVVALLFSCAAAHAVSEQGFAETLRDEVWPHYETGAFGSFMGVDSVRIAWGKFEAPSERGALVILPGKSESFLKYAELIYDLRDCGYSLYLMDHRGMGLSGGMLDDDLGKTHVERFGDYLLDLKTFTETIVHARTHARRVVLGHSMGGTVALRFLEMYPGVFDAAILSAPMLQIITDPLPEPVAFLFRALTSWAGLGTRYCPGHGPWEPGTFQGNRFTHSAVRWSLWEESLIPSHRFAGMGGATVRWLHESMRAASAARENASHVHGPVLLFQAGLDALVKPEGQDETCRDLRDCVRVVFAEAHHEILMERDEIRDQALERILSFLARSELGSVNRRSGCGSQNRQHQVRQLSSSSRSAHRSPRPDG
jgi:lysophospholipase